jgi:hypothetical protein
LNSSKFSLIKNVGERVRLTSRNKHLACLT